MLALRAEKRKEKEIISIKHKVLPMKRVILSAVIAALCAISVQAHFMSKVWPQKSLKEKTVGKDDAWCRILIIGAASPFKSAVVDSVISALQKDSVFIQVKGLKAIEKTNPSEWDAVILVNRCAAWDYDSRVKKLVKEHPDYKHYILFTTSADKEKCTDKKRLPVEVDAVSSASISEKVGSIAAALAKMLRKHLER